MSSIVKSSLAAAVFALACLFAAPGQAAQVDMTDVIFKEVEKRLIREYFATQGGGRDEDRDSGRRYGKGHGGKGQSGRDIGEKYRKKYEKNRGKNYKNNRGNKHGKKGLPPGLAKRNGLPPGLAKREQLPPGLAKRALPPGLSGALPPTPEGTERAIVGNNVVLIQKATGVVLDILLDAVGQAK